MNGLTFDGERMKNKLIAEPPMNGMEKYTCGMELRWVIGTPETGPAKIYDSLYRVAFSGTYAGAMDWIAKRGLKRVGS